MAKISRYTAEKVARKMVDDVFKDRVNRTRKRIQEVSEKIAKREIPQEVLEFCEKWKEYITVTQSLSIKCIDNHGSTRCWVSSAISFCVPFGSTSLDVAGEDSDKLYMFNERLNQLRKKKNSLLGEITNTLLDLGTTKRVEVEFPAAASYFCEDEKKTGESAKPRKCEQLIKSIEEEREKDRKYAPAYYNHPV